MSEDPYGRFDYSGGFMVEPEAWGSAVCPVGGVAFDVGAHVGNYAFGFSDRVGPSGRVYAFEPGGYAYRILMRNIRLFHRGNISGFRFALSDYDGIGMLFCGRDGTDETFNGFVRGSCEAEPFFDLSEEEIEEGGFLGGHHYERVQVLRLDTFVSRFGVDRLDLLKVDVEGAELRVLAGARESLKRFSPLLYVEVHYGQDVLGAVSDLGYRVKEEFKVVRGTTNPIVVLERE